MVADRELLRGGPIPFRRALATSQARIRTQSAPISSVASPSSCQRKKTHDHATFAINSLAHVWGSRRYATKDESRNNPLLALVTLGEGWHNNHHRWMRSCRQGLFPGELDATYLVLRGLAKVGIVWGIKEPPARILEEGRAARTEVRSRSE